MSLILILRILDNVQNIYIKNLKSHVRRFLEVNIVNICFYSFSFASYTKYVVSKPELVEAVHS